MLGLAEGEVGQRPLAQRRHGELGPVALDRLARRRRRPARAVPVPMPGGDFAPESANMPASRMKPGETSETPTPLGPRSAAQAEGEAAQAELGRVVDRATRARRLARERGDEDEVAGAALDHRREQRLGHQHRRLEVDAQGALHLLGAEVAPASPLPAGRRWRRGRRPSPASAAELLGGAGLGEVGGQDPVPVAGQPRGHLLERLALAGAEQERRRRASASASAIARPRPPVAPVSSAVRPASSIPRRKLPAVRSTGTEVPRERNCARKERTGDPTPSAKGHKMLVFHEQATTRSSTLPPFQITETPSPVRMEAPRERGNHVFGANPPLSGGGAGSYRASPTANPVGRRRRSVCFRTPISSRLGLAGRSGARRLRSALPRAAPSADCGGGGITPAEVDICTPTPKARLLPNGMLIPPKSAPARVKAVIAAANRIRNKPYVYGGGHASWWDRGYDCSGSVSYALHGGDFLDSPLPSGPDGHAGAAPAKGAGSPSTPTPATPTR